MGYGSRNSHVWTHSHYAKVRNLREGSSGSVHLAVDLRNGSQVAIKFIPRGSNRSADIICINIDSPADTTIPVILHMHTWAYAYRYDC